MARYRDIGAAGVRGEGRDRKLNKRKGKEEGCREHKASGGKEGERGKDGRSRRRE